MRHLWSNAVDVVSWVLVFAILVVWAVRCYGRSSDRGSLVKRWIASAALILLILGILSMGSPLVDIAITIPAVILAFLWLPDVIATILKPLTSAFEGDEEGMEPKAFYFAAEGHRRKGEYELAMTEIRKQLEQFPGDHEGYVKLATIQMENLKDLPAAEATLNEFLHLAGRAPNEVVATVHLLADWQLQAGCSAHEVTETLRRIVTLYPNTALAHAAQQRIAHLDTVDEARRARHEVKYTVGKTAQEAAPGSPPPDADTRLAEFIRKLEHHPTDTDTREQLAMLYAEEFQRMDLASEQLEQLIALPEEPPKHVARWLNLLATLQIKYARDLPEAERALRRIIERFPGGAAATIASTRLATLRSELKGGEQTAAKVLGQYEKELGLKRSGE